MLEFQAIQAPLLFSQQSPQPEEAAVQVEGRTAKLVAQAVVEVPASL